MAKSRRIKPDELDGAIRDIIEDYTKEVAEGVPEDVKSTGKACVQIIRAHIDSAGIGGSKYRAAIKSDVTESNRFAATVNVWAGKHYRIAHLLEHGHPIKIKGKVVGVARAYPHFAPAEADASKLLEKKITMRATGSN